jgi:hypothetical protein
MASTALSGLTTHCAALNLSRRQVLLLAHILSTLWAQAHPQQPTGRPRTPLPVLLAGLRFVLRKGLTLSTTAALVGVGTGTLAG